MNSSHEATSAAAYGAYSQKVDLEQVTQTLNQAGLSNENICLLLASGHPLARLARDLKLLSSGADHAAASGLLNWLLRLGAVVIPRVGFFVRSRDFFHSLMVEPITSSCCGTAGTLLNLRIPERDVQRFGYLINDTGGFVYVSCAHTAQSQWAREILRRTGAEEACCFQDSPEEELPESTGSRLTSNGDQRSPLSALDSL